MKTSIVVMSGSQRTTLIDLVNTITVPNYRATFLYLAKGNLMSFDKCPPPPNWWRSTRTSHGNTSSWRNVSHNSSISQGPKLEIWKYWIWEYAGLPNPNQNPFCDTWSFFCYQILKSQCHLAMYYFASLIQKEDTWPLLTKMCRQNLVFWPEPYWA